jgi:hypothetical protein
MGMSRLLSAGMVALRKLHLSRDRPLMQVVNVGPFYCEDPNWIKYLRITSEDKNFVVM